MSVTPADIETGWTHTTAEIPERGLEAGRDLGPDALAQLATTLGIRGIARFHVDYRIDPLPKGRYRLSGTLEARVVQDCVVTLDPVTTDVRDAIDVEFWPADAIPVETGEEEQSVFEAIECEPIEAHRIAVGRVVAETLAAALPAFPRAPGAELERHEAAPAGGGSTNPFSVLANLKPKDDKPET